MPNHQGHERRAQGRGEAPCEKRHEAQSDLLSPTAPAGRNAASRPAGAVPFQGVAHLATAPSSALAAVNLLSPMRSATLLADRRSRP